MSSIYRVFRNKGISVPASKFVRGKYVLVESACTFHTFPRCENMMLSWTALRGCLFTGILISATCTLFRAHLFSVQPYPVTPSSQHYTQDLRDFDSTESDTQAESITLNDSAQKYNRWQEFGLGTAAGRILELPSTEKTTFASKLFPTRTWVRNKKATGNTNVSTATLASSHIDRYMDLHR